MTDFAVIAGAGALPQAVLAARPGAVVRFDGVPSDATSDQVIPARFEQLGKLFDDLQVAGVGTLCFAGAMARPALDPTALDAKTMAAAPQIMAAMQGGDDGLLRAVIALFEGEGFAVLGAHQVAPQLTDLGDLAGTPETQDRTDAARGAEILAALGSLDIGQACVLAGGLCLGIETLQGTDALLRFVGDTPDRLRRSPGGVLIKRPKPGQDLRVDMPAIGPDTVRAAARAGLSSICVAEGQVLILDRDALRMALAETGLTLWAMP